MTNPYVDDHSGSVLETTTVLSHLLRGEHISRDDILKIAVGQFLDYERQNIKSPSSLHLIALKKILLYATPVIAPRESNIGIALSSQVSSPAIQYDMKKNKTTECALAVNDKFRLIGFAFPSLLVNHLSMDIFQWKFFHKLPTNYKPPSINISLLNGIETKPRSIYLIKPSEYENVDLFNMINRCIAFHLNPDLSDVFAISSSRFNPTPFKTIQRITPFIDKKYIDKLNEVLPRHIDKTYTASLYETLHMTMNSSLYDNIHLRGFESSLVNSYLSNLAYVKSQNIKVRANLKDVQQQLLLNTRAEKITREKYPYLFDFTDRRSIFTKFNRFHMDKLPKDAKNNIRILLDKEIASQQALLVNKCEHVPLLKALQKNDNSEEFHKVEQYINYDSIDDTKMYSCKLCTYPMLCAHEIELYESIASIDNSNNSDGEYWIRQKIINKYKVVNQQRTGDEDTETAFTFYCKYCGGELGKSEDIIQSTIKSQIESSVNFNSNPIHSTIYMYISAAVNLYMNQSIVPMSKKQITSLIYEESKSAITGYVNGASNSDQENIDLMIRYLSTIYCLSALVSINMNKLKSTESIIIQKPTKDYETREAEPISGGVDLKQELISALKIIQNTTAYKRIGITEDKIKSMLIETLKFMNKVFAQDGSVLKARTAKELLELDIRSSPIGSYALSIASRYKKDVGIIEAVGVDIEQLYPKNKKTPKPETHALYKNIFNPTKKESTDDGRYIVESYQSIVDFVRQEPINGKYTSIITPPTSDFIRQFERKRHKQLKIDQSNPYRFLPVENSREYDFDLKNYHIGYCLNEDGSSRPHRWTITQNGKTREFICKHCKVNIKNADKKNNEHIEHALYEQMNVEAFFELYTLACPVKDAHIYEADECIQCKVSKTQLKAKDTKYYKRYSSTYSKYRQANINDLLDSAQSIGSYASELKRTTKDDVLVAPDYVVLESVASSLSKIYGHDGLQDIGMDSTKKRSLEIIESYVRMLYSHYTFVKNLSIDIKSHPDTQFFAFVKQSFFDGIKVKSINLHPLPNYPTSTNADQLLIELFQIIYDLSSKSNAQTNMLVKFIISKIVQHDMRRQEFNFAKLKSVTITEDDETIVIQEIDQEEEEEIDIFNGYDIDEEDLEDNLHGEID